MPLAYARLLVIACPLVWAVADRRVRWMAVVSAGPRIYVEHRTASQAVLIGNGVIGAPIRVVAERTALSSTSLCASNCIIQHGRPSGAYYALARSRTPPVCVALQSADVRLTRPQAFFDKALAGPLDRRRADMERAGNAVIRSISIRVEQDVGPAQLAGCDLPSLGHGKQSVPFFIRQCHKIPLGHGTLLFLVQYTGGEPGQRNHRGGPLIPFLVDNPA